MTSDSAATRLRICSAHICMAAMSERARNEPPQSSPFAHYLPKSFHA